VKVVWKLPAILGVKNLWRNVLFKIMDGKSGEDENDELTTTASRHNILCCHISLASLSSSSIGLISLLLAKGVMLCSWDVFVTNYQMCDH